MHRNTHFIYQTEVNRFKVDFYLINELIGIVVDCCVPTWEVKTIHVSNSMIVKVGCFNIERVRKALEDQLVAYGVKTKYIREIDTDTDDW